MAILAIHTDCFKLLILAISCKNLGDEYPDSTAAFRLPGRLPPDLSPAQFPSRTRSFPPHLPDRGTDLVCPKKPDQSLFFLLALPTSASTAC